MLHPVLSLYRQILRRAIEFPSIKRNKLIVEIKSSFRSNKNETDKEKVRTAIAIAQKGVEQLEKYTSLRHKKGNWEVSLEENPIPRK